MSGLFGGTTIKGNQITDFADQTSTVGIPIPFGYGTFQVTGNVIWVSGVTTHVTKKKQGKGGVTTENYTYSRSYAIGFCEGQIYGYLTLTRNGKIVYTTDPNATVEDRDFANKWKQKATFYYGTRTQMPDSTIEAKEGAGEVSAFRDLAYIVVENDDVTDLSGAVPSYEAIVVATPPEVYLTSRPYPVETTDSMTGVVQARRVHFQPQPTIQQDALHNTVTPMSINRFGGQKTYVAPNEDRLQGTVEPLEIVRFGGQKIYIGPNEDRIQGTVAPLAINRYGSQVAYAPLPEEITSTVTPIEITREVD